MGGVQATGLAGGYDCFLNCFVLLFFGGALKLKVGPISLCGPAPAGGDAAEEGNA